jgi:hypothetical protein
MEKLKPKLKYFLIQFEYEVGYNKWEKGIRLVKENYLSCAEQTIKERIKTATNFINLTIDCGE